ncbi:MAG: hypothetical protein EHM20_05035 [Alphaproteobacteria bacterium]|nr:MAG: hypothetical protein EHM20_05035 [Alphaproteobacteria bacterium]
MKAVIVASVLFFSLRAMSGEVGEDKKGECIYASQNLKREAKIVAPVETEIRKETATKAISK